MIEFEYDETSPQAEYYEILADLMERWETETVEFKEARKQYSEEKIGQYFSAISNEANLKNLQYGWFILGVSEQRHKFPVGTAFKQGDPMLLEKFKYEISKDLSDGMTFIDIIELKPIYEGKPKRVLMFKIPAAIAGIPTEWKTRYYARNGESLVSLQQFKIDTIRNQQRRDWSKQFLSGATIESLDRDAIQTARKEYIKKMNRIHISEEVNSLTDEEFLTKMKLMSDGKVTNAAMILLGKAESEFLFDQAPIIMWRLFEINGEVKDYRIFSIPFINVADRAFGMVRNLTYRYMANPKSLTPYEAPQYDEWLLRELLYNCIAHSNYLLGGRIYINEIGDSIIITNPGDFIPQSVEKVLKKTYNPPFYRNQLLAKAMTDFGMIDTSTSGIKRVYRILKSRYFPMPDYDFSTPNQVAVTVYGKILDQRYTYLLYDNPNLDMETVFLLDQVQKGRWEQLSDLAVDHLLTNHLVEEHDGYLFLSSSIAESIGEKERYIRNKAFDDQYYRDLIVRYLKRFGKAKKREIRLLLWDKLSDALDEKKKERKISTLLETLKTNGIIETDSPNRRSSYWILVDDQHSSD